jgi:hypothetical protein
VQPNTETKNVSVLDIGDVAHASEVSTLHFDDKQRPHWVATDGERIVLVNDPNAVDHRIWMLQFDPRTGRLTLDTAFRNAGAERPGFSFDGISVAAWCHGRCRATRNGLRGDSRPCRRANQLLPSASRQLESSY